MFLFYNWFEERQQEVRGIDRSRMRRLSTTLDQHLRSRPNKDALAEKGLFSNCI